MSNVNTEAFYEDLVDQGVGLFVGVPDSLLKNLGACIKDKSSGSDGVITANEGNAVAMAAGYHLATSKHAAVYMQNSGLGNAVNPLLSLAHSDVYGVPMLLIIGWRGEPGVKDEPQHKAQGRVTPAMLEAMEVPHLVLDPEDWEAQVREAFEHMRDKEEPFALLVRKGTFSPYEADAVFHDRDLEMSREEALGVLLEEISPDAYVVSTTGKTSRELFELREERGEPHFRDFLTVGGMGHTSSIAFGLSLGTDEPVYCIDGDGSFLMHMGAAPIIADSAPENFHYVIINNGAHESVGGQPTVGFETDMEGILLASGFDRVKSVTTAEEFREELQKPTEGGKTALVVETLTGSRSDLGRPTITPSQNKKEMRRSFEEARR